MADLDGFLASNRAYAASSHATFPDSKPARHVAVLTCMDCRIDPLAVLGLELGEAHVLRNAGARVTEDMLRSLALSTHALGVDTVVVMQHTKCGLAGVTDEALRERTGADLAFLPISDHAAAIAADVQQLAATPFLSPVTAIVGLLFDVDSGEVTDIVRWKRPS